MVFDVKKRKKLSREVWTVIFFFFCSIPVASRSSRIKPFGHSFQNKASQLSQVREHLEEICCYTEEQESLEIRNCLVVYNSICFHAFLALIIFWGVCFSTCPPPTIIPSQPNTGSLERSTRGHVMEAGLSDGEGWGGLCRREERSEQKASDGTPSGHLVQGPQVSQRHFSSFFCVMKTCYMWKHTGTNVRVISLTRQHFNTQSTCPLSCR